MGGVGSFSWQASPPLPCAAPEAEAHGMTGPALAARRASLF